MDYVPKFSMYHILYRKYFECFNFLTLLSVRKYFNTKNFQNYSMCIAFCHQEFEESLGQSRINIHLSSVRKTVSQ